MSHDIHKNLKDTEEVPSLGKGQPMQPGNDQPLSLETGSAGPGPEPVASAPEGEKVTKNLQAVQPPVAQPKDASHEGQDLAYRHPSYPQPGAQPGPPGVAPVYYQPGQAHPIPPAQAGGMPASAWPYPPRPDYYQRPATQAGGMPGAPGQSLYAAPTTSNAASGAAYYGQFGSYGPPAPAPAPRRSGLRTGTLMTLVALIALVFATGLFAGWQFGQNGSAISPGSNSAFQQGKQSNVAIPSQNGNNADAVREAVISKVQPGIVQINVTSSGQHALGSGVIIDSRGYIVTNSHVVSGASSIQITLANNQTYDAQLVSSDPADDVAVVKMTSTPGNLTTVALGDSSKLRVGQEVLAIGSPLGNAETVTSGIVSALNRNVSEGQGSATLPDAIQTDAPINPGNSGGALVDLQGNLVGMPTLNAVNTEFNTPANGLGFAIPVNRIRFIAQQIISSGKVSHTGRAILGVTVETVTASVVTQNHLSASNGVLVVSTVSSGPSASAGIRSGDVITQLNNASISSTTDLSAALLLLKPGDPATLKIDRSGQQLTINVTLGELPVS